MNDAVPDTAEVHGLPPPAEAEAMARDRTRN
jgi:hypothetical protein